MKSNPVSASGVPGLFFFFFCLEKGKNIPLTPWNFNVAGMGGHKELLQQSDLLRFPSPFLANSISEFGVLFF